MIGLLFPKQRARLVAVDGVSVCVALWLSRIAYVYIRSGWVEGRYVVPAFGWETIVAVAVQLYLLYVCDLYDEEKAATRAFVTAGAAVAAVGTAMILIVLYFFVHPLVYNRGAIALYAPLAFLLIVTNRRLLESLFPVRGPRVAVMVLCNGEAPTRDIALVSQAAEGFYEFRGIISHGGVETNVPAGIHVETIKDASEIKDVVRRNGVNELVLAKGCESRANLVREVIRLSYDGVNISDPFAFFERVTRKLPCEHMDDAFLLSCHVGKRRSVYTKVKRLADVALSAVLIILTLPLWLIIAAVVKLSSPGPVLLVQERVGLEGRPFKLLKFRTMIKDAEPNGEPVLAVEDDPRVTKIGKFLRKTRLDELPQLINVLKGDMSIVGPRPERARFVEQFEREIPYYRERLAMRPGITGWAQVNFGYAQDEDTTKEKLQYDLYYIKNASMVLDLIIIFMTAKKMVRLGGR